ncbi:MAG: transposase [Candidatus Omnitrophica bacterium COP1]|nr:transposase [Candidatus Omnitrophica bacterium COP1]
MSRSGYYKWRCHKPSRREKANTGIMAEIQAVHAKSRASYGSPRIQAALKKGGMCLSRKRVAGSHAVAFGYRPESACLKWTSTTPIMYARRRTHSRENGNPQEGRQVLRISRRSFGKR